MATPSGLTWGATPVGNPSATVGWNGALDGVAHTIEQVGTRMLSTGQVERIYRFKAGATYHPSLLLIAEGTSAYTAVSLENTYLDGAGIPASAPVAQRQLRIIDVAVNGNITTTHGAQTFSATLAPASRKIFDLGGAPTPVAIPAWALLGSPRTANWAAYTQPAPPSETYPSRGVWRAGMGNAGITGDIGPVTEWSMAYAYSPTAVRMEYLLNSVRCFAQYHRIHWRTGASFAVMHAGNSVDECSNYASTVKSLPGIEFNTTTSGGAPFSEHATDSHIPEVGFVAYLASGRLYCMYEAQHVSAYCSVHAGGGAPSRDGDRALVLRGFRDENYVGSGYTFQYPGSFSGFEQLRGSAWSLLRHLQAARISPDNDGFSTHYRAVVLPKNGQYLDARYSNQSAGGYPGEQIGILSSSAYIQGPQSVLSYSWFQHEYMLMAVQSAKDFGFPEFDGFHSWLWGKYFARQNHPNNWVGIVGMIRMYMFSTYAPTSDGSFDLPSNPYLTNWGDVLTATGNKFPEGPAWEVTSTPAAEAQSTVVGGVLHKPMDVGLTSAQRRSIVNAWLDSFGAEGHWQYKPRFSANEAALYHVDQQWWPYGRIIDSILPRIPGTAAAQTRAFLLTRDTTNEQPPAGFMQFMYESHDLAPIITSTNNTSGQHGVAGTFQATATSGTPPYTWSLSGAPAGVTINTSTGLISWTNGVA